MPSPFPGMDPFLEGLLWPDVHHRLASVEVRDTARNEFITAIEILSPVNKREPGLAAYRTRHERIYRAGVHLLEIDLLRRGVRPLANHPRFPESHYLITLTRSRSATVELWPLGLHDPLPTVPVPLRAPDPDVRLELAPSLAVILDEGAYDLSVDYREPPAPPPLTAEERTWVEQLVEEARRRGE